MIGVIGTGMLGSAVALRLIHTGHKVSVYNRTESKTRAVHEAGGMVLPTPAKLAEISDIVFTVVRDAEAVRAVSFGEDGIAGGAHNGMLVADMSTILPFESHRIHKRFQDLGISWLDVPVMGGPDAAAEGRLVAMVGGKRSLYNQVCDVLDALAKTHHYLGPAGSAHSVKLAMNLQIAMLALSLSEGMCMARGLGVAPETFLEVLNSTYFGTGMSRKKAFRMASGHYPATFTLRNLTKDLETMRDAAEGAGMKLPMLCEALRIYEGAVAHGLGDLDYTGIMEYINRTAN